MKFAKDRQAFIVNALKKKRVEVEVLERHMDQETKHTFRGVEINKVLKSEPTASSFLGFGPWHGLQWTVKIRNTSIEQHIMLLLSGSGLVGLVAEVSRYLLLQQAWFLLTHKDKFWQVEPEFHK